ncbi:CPBP family intramembrane glutamic endopeptidase [Clostridium grantii]|uniref:CAAX prenyl protease 2/Lysostaphin resistance protein A-like domain-containing protein n=1 Tax=Clostridium grantii DSM 8605 TaxID=1121316 RepID=A0A1M5VN39_9CLOT|nr:type II CAAX endopeptidase family protein [Clostridium grantii]SHH76620.1 hypothetical protein SAMN02745207_02375 [Clostridium grantii DSM 8605]
MDDNNEAKSINKSMKKDFNKLGLALVMYTIILNVVVLIGVVVAMIIQAIKNPNMSEVQAMQILDDASFTGTLSIIAVIIAFIPILIYRKKKFFQYDLKVVNKKFTLKTILIAFIILFSINGTMGVLAEVLEFLLNTVGLTASSSLEALEALNQPAISLFLYTCLIGPIFEEFVYRGVVLRNLEKYGKWFAILVSSILFGLMHGNFYQIFMAIGVGIVLGYVATEYSIKMSIILHIFNNTIVQLMSEVNSYVGENVGTIIDYGITIICIIIVISIFIRYKDTIKQWVENNRIEKKIIISFFTTITIIIKIGFDLFMVAQGITRLR